MLDVIRQNYDNEVLLTSVSSYANMIVLCIGGTVVVWYCKRRRISMYLSIYLSMPF
jgi:hypothetical protein